MVAPRNTAYAEESAEVEVLYANLEKLRTLTKKIQGSMTRLEENGRTVKEAIGPIYSNTQTLQTTNNNVDRINEAIDRIRKPLDVKAREERIIRDGPRTVGLDNYLSSMKRVEVALSDLTQTNLRSNQQAISEFSLLLDLGSQQLQDIFKTSLQEDVQPVEPLHYITKQLSFPTFEPDKAALLRSMNGAISASMASQPQKENPAGAIYADIRGPYIRGSLTNLATATINTAKRTAPNTIYRQGTSGIGAYASSIEGIVFAEYENICAIFSPSDCGRALDLACRSALAEFAKTLRELHTQIKQNITTDCFLAYEVIDVVFPLSSHIDAKTGELKAAFFEALKPIRETAKASFYELLEDTRNRVQNSPAPPNDGSALPITSEVMTRLQAMTAYPHPLSSILASLGDGNWKTASPTSANTPLDVGVDGRQLLGNYITDSVDALLSSLENKARTLLKGKLVIGVFLANNLAVVTRTITTSDLASLLASNPKSGPKLEMWRKKSLSLYLDAWKDCSHHLLDVQYTSRTPRPSSSGTPADSAAIIKSLSSKDKDSVKEKFKGFNAAFDDLLQKHKGINMEKEVKANLGKEVQGLLEPLYGRFWERYHEIDRGRGKYVKFDKGNLAAQLSALG
ncbi:MAG: exocyst complex component exo70 [Cirrosporium novae-zelandiae]|nr:MAG: exocyst complex component exo70 [Cirrosporium novae-zelandiae]